MNEHSKRKTGSGSAVDVPTLETDRLRLVSPLSVKLAELVACINDPEIARTTLMIPHPYSEKDGREWLDLVREQHVAGAAAQFAMTRIDTGAIVGGIGLVINRMHQNAELGYWIARSAWGCGYATEAGRAVVAHGFEALELERIHAHHFVGNPASGRVLQKIGMKHEGKLRRHIYKNGEFIDIEMYGILREEHASR